MEAWLLHVTVVAAMVIMSSGGCSRPPFAEPEVELEPMPHPYRIYVTFPTYPSQQDPPHHVTDPSVIARIESVVNAKRGGWQNVVHAWGKAPIAEAELEFWFADAGNSVSTMKLGDSWILRGPMLQGIPKDRADEILRLLRARAGGDESEPRP
jgi:hypothetical protein